MKKTLSFLLALTILLGVLPFSAAAKDTINEVHISVNMPKDVVAYSNIPTVPDEYRTQYKIAKWFWYNETKGEKLAQNVTFNIIDTYSLNLILNSTSAYDFANNGVSHSFATFADGISAEKYSAVTAKSGESALGDSASVKITFVSDRNVPKIEIRGIPQASEGNTNGYNLSYGTYVTKISDYDNGTTIKNGVMWEDITDPDNEVTMNIGDKFLGTHSYRITAYFKTLDTFKYNISTDNISVSGCKIEMLDLDGEGFVTRFKITHEYSAIPHEKHNWVQSTIKKASVNEDGLKSNECSICGAVLPDTVIPKVNIVRITGDNQYYNKNGSYYLDIYMTSNLGYNYRQLQVGKDFDVVFTKTGESVYEKNNYTIKKLALGTFGYQIRFKGDFEGVLNRKITVGLYEPRFEHTSGKTAVKLTWNKVDGATFYRVFEKDVKTGKVKCLASKVTAGAFVVKNKLSGTKHLFAVRAYRTTAAGKTYCSGYSFKEICTRCDAPVIKASVKGNKVTISWKAVRGAGNYTLYKYNSGKEVYEQFKFYHTTKTTITFSAVKGTYFFKVTANDRNGTSGLNFSKPVKVIVK